MDIDFKEIVLNNYGRMRLKADVDEDPKDIIAAVLYDDHGDDFLAIKTKEASYKYGLWVTRNGWDPRVLTNENHIDRKRFLKVPKLNGEFDYHSEVSNEIYRFLNEELHERDSIWGRKSEVRKDSSTRSAQWRFDYIYSSLKGFYEKNVIYHKESDELEEITKFLEINDISTEENLKKLNDIKTFLRIGAIDGIAGKQPCYYDRVVGDDISWIYFNGKQIHKKYNHHGIKVKRFWQDDEWGGYGVSVNLGQFDRLKGESE